MGGGEVGELAKDEQVIKSVRQSVAEFNRLAHGYRRTQGVTVGVT